MKHLWILPIVLLLAVPAGAFAQADQISGCCPVGYTGYYGPGMMNGQQTGPGFMGPGMMGEVEQQALGNATYQEIQSLMLRMMSGTLNQTERARLVQLMDDHPGPYGMMMSQMMAGQGYYGSGYACSMMGGSTGPCGTGLSGGMIGWMIGGMVLIGLLVIVWIIAGILLIVYLWRAISKK